MSRLICQRMFAVMLGFAPEMPGREAVKRFLIALGGCVLSSLGTAAAAAEEDPFLADLPIVLTPSRLQQPQNEAPAAVTVIDRALIKATGYRDIPRLLRLVPGMQIGQERGSRHWVTYHGMGNDYPSWMQVLIDGRSVYSPGNLDGVDWSALPITIEEIERIEVVRGTNSAAYGANAFLGVINIITRDSADSPGKKLAVHAGTRGIRDLGLELSGGAGAGSLRLNAETKGDQGFAGLHDAMHYNVFSLRGDQRLSNNDELMFRLAASDGWRGLGYPDSIFGNNAERRANSTNAALHLQWRHTPGPSEEWLLHYYRNQDRTDEAWFAAGPSPYT
ncbi:MAG: TonB-dependent receptor plug domain-containing protein, partial [Rhodocyclaceae bacterium]|nr:TonB-dependent receptor plug domain-containing protein [Rhodocyclaceae bacterium]